MEPLKFALRLLLIFASLALFACSDFEARELAGGYRLKRTEGANQFALVPPFGRGSLVIDEIGWDRPVIIARSTGSDNWIAINTERARHGWISDAERKTSQLYRSIQTEPADAAWNKLNGNKRLW